MENQAARANKPLRMQTVRGIPYEVGGRTLIPVARMTTFGKGRATVGRDRVQGWAGGFCRIVPQSVIVKTVDGEQYVPITDATQSVLRRILVTALAMTLLFGMFRRLARAIRRRGDRG